MRRDAWQLSNVNPSPLRTHCLICSKCRMKMLSVAQTLLTFMSASEVSEMPSELAKRMSFRYCGTAPSTTPAMKMNITASAPLEATCDAR